MSAVILNGKNLAQKIRLQIKEEVDKDVPVYGRPPCLVVILVGDNPASRIYVANKQNACKEVGIKSIKIELDASCNEATLTDTIEKLNQDETVDGILLQLPIPSHLNEEKMTQKIDPDKDVDGFHIANMGKLLKGMDVLAPCTPAGIIRLLDEHKIGIESKNVCIVGRSNIVGKPASLLFLRKNATVTICHSRTSNLVEQCKRADILVTAIGKLHFIKSNMVKEGAVVVDVGINRNEKGKVVGDVDFEDVKEKCFAITPVPGGIGPMTIAMLLENTYKIYHEKKGSNPLTLNNSSKTSSKDPGTRA